MGNGVRADVAGLGPKPPAGRWRAGAVGAVRCLWALLMLSVGALHAQDASNPADVSRAVAADEHPTYVRFAYGAVRADSPAVHVVGRVVTLTAPGTYHLSGRLDNGRLVVSTQAEGPVTLVLDGLSVYAATGPALAVEAADEVVLNLASGSYNSFFDGAERLPGEEGSAVFSEAPLTIGGPGHLLVMAGLKHGVTSEGLLRVNGGVLTVQAADDGLRGENLVVTGGDLLVFSANDALKATGEAPGLGEVRVAGGAIDLIAQGDGVQAERRLVVSGGLVEVLAGGGHEVAPNDDSTKGLKADVEVVIEGGTLRVDASDDAVHSDGDIRILGGYLTLATGDDAVHADGSLLVAGGWVEVTASWEGLEAPVVTVTGGTVVVQADDDALNGAGDGPASELLVDISGGHLFLSAGSDAIDSNGAVRVTGGTVVLNGPYGFAKPAIDRHLRHTVLLAGGTVAAAGALVLGRDSAIDPLSTQAVVYLDFDWFVPEGTLVALKGEDGFVATFRAQQTLTRMSFTSPEMEAGAVYELWLGGVPVGDLLPGGMYDPAGVIEAEFRREVRAY